METTTCVRCNTAPAEPPDSWCKPCRKNYYRGRYLRLPNDEDGRRLVAEYKALKKARAAK